MQKVSLDYVSEKISTGVMEMATMRGTPQERLAAGILSGVYLFDINSLPAEAHDDWKQFIALTRNVDDKEQGSIQASCLRLTDSEVSHAVDMLFCVWSVVDSHLAMLGG